MYTSLYTMHLPRQLITSDNTRYVYFPRRKQLLCQGELYKSEYFTVQSAMYSWRAPPLVRPAPLLWGYGG
jgi:hypothetical protein